MLRNLQHKSGRSPFGLKGVENWGKSLVKLNIHHSSDHGNHATFGHRGCRLGSGCRGSRFGLCIGIMSLMTCEIREGGLQKYGVFTNGKMSIFWNKNTLQNGRKLNEERALRINRHMRLQLYPGKKWRPRPTPLPVDGFLTPRGGNGRSDCRSQARQSRSGSHGSAHQAGQSPERRRHLCPCSLSHKNKT